MADPVTMMAGAGIGTSALGGIMGAGASREAASASASASRYQAAVALLNAKIARQNADYASVSGEQEAMRYGMGARQRAGEIVSAQSASGLDVTSGSNKLVQDSQHLVSEMDMAQIRQNAAKTAYDYRVQAGMHTAEAMAQVMGANNAVRQGRTAAMSSIIGGASSVADKWLRMNEYGLPKLG